VDTRRDRLRHLDWLRGCGQRACGLALRTLANLLEAIREGDYSIRARGARARTRWGGHAAGQRDGSDSSAAAPGRDGSDDAAEKVIEEIDVAIFAFDSDHRLKLINPPENVCSPRPPSES